MFPIAFYHAPGDENSRLSDYLGMNVTETSKRPVYALEKQVEYDGRRWRALYLSLFFRENPGYTVCFRGGVGRHEADVERVVVLLDDSDQCGWVYYGAHGRGQGVWLHWEDCPKDNKGRLQVFVSPSSHGMYPWPRRVLRTYGFTNEHCDRCTSLYVPRAHDFVNALEQSWSHKVRHINPIVQAPNNPVDPDLHSMTDLERLFLGWPPLTRRLASSQSIKVLPPQRPLAEPQI